MTHNDTKSNTQIKTYIEQRKRKRTNNGHIEYNRFREKLDRL